LIDTANDRVKGALDSVKSAPADVVDVDFRRRFAFDQVAGADSVCDSTDVLDCKLFQD
jgi:hypothetical protein